MAVHPSAQTVGGDSRVAGGSFTRPADTTAYASGDLVANSTTAGSVTPVACMVTGRRGGTGIIRRCRLTKTSTSLTNAGFRIHIYKFSPTCTNGDNGAWLTTDSTWIGSLDVTIDKAFSDASKGIGTPTTGSELLFSCDDADNAIYALVEARAAYTPTSAEVFTVALEVMAD